MLRASCAISCWCCTCKSLSFCLSTFRPDRTMFSGFRAPEDWGKIFVDIVSENDHLQFHSRKQLYTSIIVRTNPTLVELHWTKLCVCLLLRRLDPNSIYPKHKVMCTTLTQCWWSANYCKRLYRVSYFQMQRLLLKTCVQPPAGTCHIKRGPVTLATWTNATEGRVAFSKLSSVRATHRQQMAVEDLLLS